METPILRPVMATFADSEGGPEFGIVGMTQLSAMAHTARGKEIWEGMERGEI